MSKTTKKRRTFLKQATAFSIFGLIAGSGMGISWKVGENSKRLLRPPGTVDDFLSLCIKCGQCLQVCPYSSIELSSLAEGNGVGAPFINANKRGCYLCPLLPCVLACPSGALDHGIDSVKEVDMGKAKVVNLSSCLALENKPVDKSAIKRAFINSHTITKEEAQKLKFLSSDNMGEKRELEIKEIKKIQNLEGKPCTICVDMCPYPNQEEAIELIDSGEGKKPIIKQECVGCGVCVELCPTGVLAIVPKEILKESA